MYKYNLICFANSRSGHNFIMRNLAKWHIRDLQIFDMVNIPLINYKKFSIKNNINTNFDKNIKVIVIRDLLNWIISIFLFKNKFNREIEFKMDYWNETVKEFFGETNFIGEDTIKIYFDKFLFDVSYRNKILLDFPKYKEEDMDFMPSEGGGSSFDGLKFQNYGTQMKVLNRFELIPLYPEILDILKKNSESVRLYNKYFKPSEEKKEILKLI